MLRNHDIIRNEKIYDCKAQFKNVCAPNSRRQLCRRRQLWRCTQERLSVTALWPIFHRERKSHKKSRAQFSETDLNCFRHVTALRSLRHFFHNFSFYSAIKASHQLFFDRPKPSLKAGFDFRRVKSRYTIAAEMLIFK